MQKSAGGDHGTELIGTPGRYVLGKYKFLMLKLMVMTEHMGGEGDKADPMDGINEQRGRNQ